ncbi:MAG: glycoside hydrolase family 3 C-terminal domain-containing protein [Bacteroidales bacterium]|nr:glycoside hydrolase family 3 C-terminal domain-containing protein [Bacteroidales bacterium]
MTFRTLILSLTAGLFLTMGAYAQESKEAAMHKKAVDLISQMTLDEKISMMMNSTPGVERLGIKPYDWWNEALHGVARNGRATVFPEPIGLGATFDPELVRKIGDIVSDEGRAKFEKAREMENYNRYTGLTFWAPNVNIFRDPRWGRGMETYGEDPYLTGTMGSAYVKGIQGDDPFYLKAAACAKHFAVHSGPESVRHSFNALPNMKDLYETYLPAFERLVKDADVEVVMGAYNRVFGESASGSTFLLTNLLREQWGFDGHIVSDCGAVDDIYGGHHIAKDAAEASAIAIKAGLNLECGNSFRSLKTAIERGLLTEADIDEALEPLLMTQLKLGILFNDPDCPYYGIPASVIGSPEHYAVARQAAVESMVLLKNDNDLLPLRKDIMNVYVTGTAATDTYSMMGNYFGISDHYSTYLQGIVAKVSDGTNVNYKPAYTIVPTRDVNPGNYATAQAASADYTIMFMGNNGTTEGEESDAISSPSIGDRLNIDLPDNQLSFFREVVKMRSKNNHLIVVVTGGSPVNLQEIAAGADAVIMAWYPGQEGGDALAELLFGEKNFSGRLPITFPISTYALPPFSDYDMRGRTYKYMTGNTMYPFGYGLSYGSSQYGDLKVVTSKPKLGSPIELEIPVTNTGKVDRTETVQLYVSTPNAGQGAAFSQLVAFERVSLKPGESRNVRFTVTPEQMREFQRDGSTKLLKGTYKITVGAAAPTQRSQELDVPLKSVSIKL